VAPGHFLGDIDLVRQVPGARTDQPPGGRSPETILVLNGGVTQPERPVTVKLAGKQTLVRGRKIDRAGQLHFGDLVDVLTVIGVVHEHTADIFHGPDDVAVAVKGLYVLADLEHDAGQGRVVDGIGTLLIRRREAQGDPTPGNIRDDPQAQPGVAVTDPALTNDKIRCFQEASKPKLLAEIFAETICRTYLRAEPFSRTQ